jgi:hypothetical protein
MKGLSYYIEFIILILLIMMVVVLINKNWLSQQFTLQAVQYFPHQIIWAQVGNKIDINVTDSLHFTQSQLEMPVLTYQLNKKGFDTHHEIIDTKTGTKDFYVTTIVDEVSVSDINKDVGVLLEQAYNLLEKGEIVEAEKIYGKILAISIFLTPKNVGGLVVAIGNNFNFKKNENKSYSSVETALKYYEFAIQWGACEQVVLPLRDLKAWIQAEQLGENLEQVVDSMRYLCLNCRLVQSAKPERLTQFPTNFTPALWSCPIERTQ